MRLGTRAAAVAITAALALSGCGGSSSDGGSNNDGDSGTDGGAQPVQSDAPLSDVAADDEAVGAAQEALRGVFTGPEVECILKGLAAKDITADEILEYTQAPKPGPIADAYKEIIPTCIDKAAVVEPVPPGPEVRAQFIIGATSVSPELTTEQAACIFDGLIANGVSARDLVLADYDDTIFVEKIEPVFPKLDCNLG